MNGSEHEQAGAEHSCPRGRREVLLGGLALGALLLTGCNQRRATSGSGSVTVANGPIYGPGTSPTTAKPFRPVPTPARPAPGGSAQVSILPRNVWTRQGIARPRECYDMNGVSRITVHHSAMDSTSLRSQSDVVGHLESIRATHVRNGWADIGYHYVVDPDGRVWECRASWKQGAHVKDQNEHNLGVMVLGNFEHQRPTAASLDSLERLIAMQMQKYRVPVSRVYTHREIGKSACPGRNMQASMNSMRRGGMLASALSGPVGHA